MSGVETERPDPEVPERARRRRFTAKYKLEILAAYDAAPDGEKGGLLRREGLHSRHIVRWRRARDRGAPAWAGRLCADVSGATRKPSGSPALSRISGNWSRCWPRPSWWMYCTPDRGCSTAARTGGSGLKQRSVPGVSGGDESPLLTSGAQPRHKVPRGNATGEV